MDTYTLPLYQKSSLKKSLKFLYLFFVLFFLILSILIFIFITKENPIMGIVFSLILLVLSIFFMYLFINIEILKKFQIEITYEYIKITTPFIKKFAFWKDIYNVQLYNYQNNPMLSFLLIKDLNKKTKSSICNNLNSLLGIPPTSFQISLNLFKDIDMEKLYNTIVMQLDKVSVNDTNIITEISNNIYNRPNNNLIKSIILSFIFTFIIGIIYGLSIYKLESNYLIIPILGSLLIISVFNKYYLEKSFKLSIRCLVGFICSLQVPISIISMLFIDLKSLLPHTKLLMILKMLKSDVKYIIYNPIDHFLLFLIFIVSFGIGFLYGRVSKKNSEEHSEYLDI